MEHFTAFRELLGTCGIDTVGVVKLSDCKLLREYKLKNAGFNDLSSLFVYIFAIPYYSEYDGERNISAYAAPRDYHAYFEELKEYLISDLSEKYPHYKFAGFTDNSPIDEIHAAAIAGLGVIGQNGLLITEKYSSYVFLGEIITDMPTYLCQATEIRSCIGCGKCIAACPKSQIGECLSSLTQKKGELTKKEMEAIKKYGSAWGCDICQEVCPYTLKAKADGTLYTPIEFFKTEITPHLDRNLILSMSDEEFSLRAYSWRKRETVLRNLDILSK